MPTIEIEVPEGRCWDSVERVRRRYDVSDVELLLAGVDAIATERVPEPSTRKVLHPTEETCEWNDCGADANLSVHLPWEPKNAYYYCGDCFDAAADWHKDRKPDAE